MSTAKNETFIQEGVWQVEWPSLLTGENGDMASLSKWPTKSIQVSGTVGAGGSINVQGSNNGVDWATLDESTGDGLGTMGVGIKDILQNTKFIRPAVVSGDGTTNIRVVIIAT